MVKKDRQAVAKAIRRVGLVPLCPPQIHLRNGLLVGLREGSFQGPLGHP